MQPDYKLRQLAHARLRLLKDAERLGNVSEACRRHGVSRKAFYKWKARYDGTIESLMDRSRRPHSHPQQLTHEEHKLIDRVARKHKRKGLYWLHWVLRTYHGFTRSVGGLYKALKRLGFYAFRKPRRRRRYRRYERPHPGANVQIDVKYLPQIRGKKEYQFTAIDEHSRLRHADIYEDLTPQNAVRFLRDALDFFQRHQIRVLQVQTDHGVEFTYAMFPHVTVEHPFERELRKESIARKLTPIGKPHLQGKVERSHRIDEDEFHAIRFFRTSHARKRAFKAHITHYNHQRPHGSLNWRSPVQHLRAWQDNQCVTYA
ncbi:MAG: IS481 family transposase [Planctomycetota bacterium]|nr:IS481 family transposase [Planctomycetota bacterium]